VNQKPLILIVDDDPNFLEIATAKLVAAGFQVESVDSQAAALTRAAEIKPALVLMDVHMPVRTGTDTALALKSDPRTKDLRVVFLSNLKEPWEGFKGEERGRLAKEIGAEHFLDKSLVIDNLGEVVKKILATK